MVMIVMVVDRQTLMNGYQTGGVYCTSPVRMSGSEHLSVTMFCLCNTTAVGL